MSVNVKKVIVGFHNAIDGGLLVPSLPSALTENFELWVKKKYPVIYENRSENEDRLIALEDLERLLIDEHEGPGPLVKYVETIDEKYLPEIFRSFHARIKEYYSNSGDLDPQDDQQKSAINTLKLIDDYLQKI